MTDAPEHDPLADLWAATEAPARDAHFELAVEERIARRLMLVDAAGLLVAGAAGATALWGFWPTAVRVLDGPVLAAAAAVSAAAWWLARPRIA